MQADVDALVGGKGLLAVHPAPDQFDGWTVTQIETGGAIYTFRGVGLKPVVVSQFRFGGRADWRQDGVLSGRGVGPWEALTTILAGFNTPALQILFKNYIILRKSIP